MAEVKVFSYMLTLLVGGKIIKGLVTSGLGMKPNFEELLLKEDEGVAEKELKDSDLEMTFSGKTIERDSTEISTHEDFETLRTASLLGQETVFSYGNNTRIVTGTGTISAFSETAGSEKVLGDFSGSIQAKSGDVSDTGESITADSISITADDVTITADQI